MSKLCKNSEKIFDKVRSPAYHLNTISVSIGDRECISSACKKVIEWLARQETDKLEKKDWFSIVRKLCTSDKVPYFRYFVH